MPLTTECADTDDVLDIEDIPAESAADDADGPPAAPSKQPVAVVRRAILFGVATVVTLAALTGWLGFHAYRAHQWQAERSQFLQAARQGAVNLTTIDWQHGDRDVQRILDGATGQFYDDFAKRSQPFIDVVEKTKSTTIGTVTEAGLESQSADSAQVLVAVTVATSNAGAPQSDPHGWRLRIAVTHVGDQAKVSNVEFVQ
ncbi:MAG: Mce-associated rane protein [Mycobacterium sp.]|jgi:Mce-associated membrane protein|nr:Mce-associated rane protein [Mycobacterium sp.]MDT5398848.1 Mce-associated rane protein [Mycobacterium sp.]